MTVSKNKQYLSIPVYLSVCEDYLGDVHLSDSRYKSGFRGEVANVKVILCDENIVEIDLVGLGIKPRVGEANQLSGISVRVCPEAVTTIAVYSDTALNLVGCCACDTWERDDGRTVRSCVYGGSNCDPGRT